MTVENKRVYELAKEFGMANKDFIEFLDAKLNIKVKSHSSNLLPAQIDKIRAALSKQTEAEPAKKPKAFIVKKAKPAQETIEKEMPNFEPSGILQEDLQNEYNAYMNNKVAINYKPPSDSVFPEEIWFLFKFIKDKKDADETYKLVGKEFFVIGKDDRVCDIHIKQKNISRQHAVIQFRKITKNNKEGKRIYIAPYLIDLNSTNGTYLNGDKIDNSKYYELLDKDNLNFGDKKIDFVLMKMK